MVRVGDLQLQIQPKVGVAQVIALASYAIDPKAWKDSPAFVTSDTDLAEAAIPALAQLTRQALRRGLLQGYRRAEDDLTTIRGRIDTGQQLSRRAGLPLPVAVTYDDYDHDILEHQLIRAAAKALGRLRLRHVDSRRELTWMRQQLHEVSDVRFDPANVPEPRWTRLNDRYRPAVTLARLVLSGAVAEAQAGHHDLASFLVNMNTVFEDFVRVCLKEHLRLTDRQFPPGAHVPANYLDVERNLRLEPDLSWWIGNRCVFVGDCKYKRPTGSIPNSDVYQMHAYLTALRLRQGVLVYASGHDVPPPATIEHGGTRIDVASIDIRRPVRDLVSDLQRLTNEIRRHAHSYAAPISRMPPTHTTSPTRR
ncbi:5-methylcytosine-specific restriction enzyme subunit McrC [Haloactinopolyspora alba]|uniref:5-methylcytosine-specific restriction enzyme subunit McrC n=1 Tax=Haloactinopolyspora alba TaxID=648780 RepID=A0A2P8EG75_9ACTN|nr:hypothetical protein [Haloactinopolyspora alba]PSL08465.1 5-methylcytosine-specific restriction enzyme subunit McrC [Haloactinopolyspora alba]